MHGRVDPQGARREVRQKQRWAKVVELAPRDAVRQTTSIRYDVGCYEPSAGGGRSRSTLEAEGERQKVQSWSSRKRRADCGDRSRSRRPTQHFVEPDRLVEEDVGAGRMAASRADGPPAESAITGVFADCGARAQVAQELRAVHDRHVDVADDQIGLDLLQPIERHLPVAHDVEDEGDAAGQLAARRAVETVGDQLRDVRVVLDEQDPHDARMIGLGWHERERITGDIRCQKARCRRT